MSTETKTPERELTEAQKLLDKPITSREELRNVIHTLENEHDIFIAGNSEGLRTHHIFYDETRPERSAMAQEIGAFETSRELNSGDSWWLLRELARERVGLYPTPTPTLEWLRSASGMAGNHFPHISKSDPTMVAFTMDHNSGVNDRQVKTTIGKLLRRFLPLMSDAQIATLEARHRAELSDEFLVAETREDVERVYTEMRGDTGCMRYGRSNWNFQDYHPSAVYASPSTGVRVAYLQDTSGAPVARTVIYDNPDNPEDKRYVRLYGAHKRLEALLRRQGYRLAGLAGAKLPALIDGRFSSRDYSGSARYYVMPYLDNPGGGSGNSDSVGTYLIHHSGSDYLTVVTREQATRIGQQMRDAGADYSYCYASGQSTNGYVTLSEVLGENDKFICGITGQEYQTLRGRPVNWLTRSGELTRAAAENLPSMTDRVQVQTLNANGSVVHAQTYLDNELVSYVHGLGWVAINLAQADELGYTSLSPKHYPTTYADTLRNSTCFAANARTCQTYDGHTILRSDAVEMYDWTDEDQALHGNIGMEAARRADIGTMRYAHKDDLRALGKLGYVSTPMVNKMRRWIKKDHPRCVATSRGRHAIYGLHALTMLSSGEWEFSSNVDAFSALGQSVYYDTAKSRYDSDLGGRVLDGLLLDMKYGLHGYTELDETAARAIKQRFTLPLIRRGVGGAPAHRIIEDEAGTRRLMAVSSYGNQGVTPEQLFTSLEETARAVNEADDAALTALGVDPSINYAAPIRCWARMSMTVLRAADAMIEQHNRARREAAARVAAEFSADGQFAVAA